MSWPRDRYEHALVTKGVKTKHDNISIPEKRNISAHSEKIKKEYVKMSHETYSKNKAKIKKLYKKYGLVFDKALYYRDKFVWENAEQKIELVSEDDVVTIYWEGKENTDLLDELKAKTKELGGAWKVYKEDKAKKKAIVKDEFKHFEGKSMAILIENEREARHKGFKHCPILKPMVKDYLEVRKRKYGKANKSVDDVVKYVYNYVNKKYPSYKKMQVKQ